MKLRHSFLILVMATCLANGLIAFTITKADALADGLRLHNLNSAPWDVGDLMTAAVLIAVALAIGGLLYWVTQRVFFDPLAALAKTAERMGRGEAAVPSPHQRGDFSRIARALATMADNIVETHTYFESRLQDTTHKLERAHQERALAERLAGTGRVSAGMAVELVRQLTNLQYSLGQLRAKIPDSGETRARLRVCDETLKRLQAFARRSVEYSRKGPERVPLLVTTPLKQALELLAPRLEMGGISVSLQVQDNPAGPGHLRVLADDADLVHVFYCVLVNAADAMPKGGTLTITVSQAMRWVLVEIVDTGVGMSMDEVAQSYDYFHSGRPYAKGEGLGLSLAHYVVRGYRGALTLNSVKGEGTRVTVELPSLESSSGIDASGR